MGLSGEVEIAEEKMKNIWAQWLKKLINNIAEIPARFSIHRMQSNNETIEDKKTIIINEEASIDLPREREFF